MGTQDPGPRIQDPSTRDPRTQDPGPGTQDSGPETAELETEDPGLRTPGPETSRPLEWFRVPNIYSDMILRRGNGSDIGTSRSVSLGLWRKEMRET